MKPQSYYCVLSLLKLPDRGMQTLKTTMMYRLHTEKCGAGIAC